MTVPCTGSTPTARETCTTARACYPTQSHGRGGGGGGPITSVATGTCEHVRSVREGVHLGGPDGRRCVLAEAADALRWSHEKRLADARAAATGTPPFIQLQRHDPQLQCFKQQQQHIQNSNNSTGSSSSQHCGHHCSAATALTGRRGSAAYLPSIAGVVHPSCSRLELTTSPLTGPTMDLPMLFDRRRTTATACDAGCLAWPVTPRLVRCRRACGCIADEVERACADSTAVAAALVAP
jgi:hypothetical protein